MMKLQKTKPLAAAIITASMFGYSSLVLSADDVPAAVTAVSSEEIAAPRKPKGAAALLMEEVVTTSRKKTAGEEVQDVPIAMTAYSGDQLEALQVRNVEELSFSMPNVQLDSVGTTRGTANFSIRGQGINSSIPSVDPTVGVFIDGMYLGMSHGALYDMFDVEGLEVLRGPQGLLFGRNVTGGAVVMRTTRPSHEFTLKTKVGITDDNDQTYGLVTTGSLIPDVLSGKLALYGRDDEGYFEDVATGNDNFGEAETYIIRPAVTWTISDDIETTLIYERGEDRGDSAIPYNSLNPAGDFKVATHVNPDSEEVGQFNNARWMHLISETTWDVGFGNGAFTNITSYRKVREESDGDLDGGTDSLLAPEAPDVFEFHTGAKINQEQFSEELRYAGSFLDDKLALTVGGYYFTQNISMAAYRDLDSTEVGGSKTPRFTYGGETSHETWGFFTNGDYQLADNIILSLGLRYTYEEKDVEAAGAFLATNSLPGLSVALGGCVFEPNIKCAPDFIDDDDWTNWTPRVAIQYYYNDTSHIYASFSKGFRSGGYNMRLTSPTQVPGPWDEESQNSWEVGLKSEWDDGRVKFNVAVFLNQIQDMIRETIFSDPVTLGSIQSIQNTADADVTGIEMDVNWLATDNLLLFANVGYLDGEYKEVLGDLDRSGVVDGDDKKLVLPRLARWTGSVGANYDIPIDSGLISSRIGYSHRTAGFFSDSNIDDLGSHDELTAGISFTTNDGKWKASLYGKNLLDQIQKVTQFTVIPGRTSFAPIKKGRVLGVELEYQY